MPDQPPVPVGTQGFLRVTVLDGDIEREHRTPRGTLALLFSDVDSNLELGTDVIATASGWSYPDAKYGLFVKCRTISLAFAEEVYNYACAWLERRPPKPLIWSELVSLWGDRYTPSEDAVPVGGMTWYGAEKRHSVAILEIGSSVVAVYSATCGGRVQHIEWNTAPTDETLVAQVTELLAPGSPTEQVVLDAVDAIHAVFKCLTPPAFDLDWDALPEMDSDEEVVATVREISFVQRIPVEGGVGAVPSPEEMEDVWAQETDQDRVLGALCRANRHTLQRGLEVCLQGDPLPIALQVADAGWDCQVLAESNAVVIRYKNAE